MNAQTNQPKLSAMLGQVATIAKVSTSSLGLKRYDKQASLESDRAHNAQAGTGRTFASRMAGCEHRCKEISDIGREAQDRLKGLTTMWGDNQRLLSNAMLQPWLEIYAPLKRDYDAKVAALVADAPALIAAAWANKGSYNVTPPDEDEIRSAYSMEFSMEQIPDSDKFTASGVDAAVQEQMRRHFEKGVESAYANAQTDALRRVAEPLQRLVERMAARDKSEDEIARGVVSGRVAAIHETAVTSVQDIAKVFRSFNLTNDPLLTSIADKLDGFDTLDVEDLKESPDLRKVVAKRAETILADLKNLI